MTEREAPDHVVPPLRTNRDFQLLWLGKRRLGVLGSRASRDRPYPACPWCWHADRVAAPAGLVGFTATIPYLLMQLPAGALVDRWNRKYISDRVRRRPRGCRGEHRPRR